MQEGYVYWRFALGMNSLKSQIMLLKTMQAAQTSSGPQGSQDCSSFVSWLTVDCSAQPGEQQVIKGTITKIPGILN